MIIPLVDAFICLDCHAVVAAVDRKVCPGCAGEALLNLQQVLDREESAEQKFKAAAGAAGKQLEQTLQKERV